MARSEPFKPDQVVHLTRYGETVCDAWVVVDMGGHTNGFYGVPAAQLVAADPPSNRGSDGRYSLDIDDRYTQPPPEEWPDEVCTALAKWRLSQ